MKQPHKKVHMIGRTQRKYFYDSIPGFRSTVVNCVSSVDKQKLFWTEYLPGMDHYQKQRMFRSALEYLRLYS